MSVRSSLIDDVYMGDELGMSGSQEVSGWMVVDGYVDGGWSLVWK